MNYYLVNQSDSFKKAIEYQCLWISKPSGRNIFHWENILRVKKDDIIFSYVEGYIQAICIPKGSCYDSISPYETSSLFIDGRRIDVDYYPLESPLSIQEMGEQLMKLQRNKYGAFCKTKDKYKTNAGYLFELTYGQSEYLLTFIDKGILPQNIQKKLELELRKVIQERIESEYQLRKIYQGIILPYSDEELDKIRKNPDKNKLADPRMKATCLERADYMCEVNHDHQTFMHASKNHHYVECHHIIPLKAQEDFSVELDDLFNLVALCPSCHAQIHYGDNEAKKEIFYKLYMCRVNEMMEKNITLKDMKRVFEKYYM